MGGKDSILVDETADLESAARGIVRRHSASRARSAPPARAPSSSSSVYDKVLARVTSLAKDIKVGPTEDPTNYMVPCPRRRQRQDPRIHQDRKEGRARQERWRSAAGRGLLCRPNRDRPRRPKARIAQEEIFGPVLAVIRAKNWKDGLAIANNTIFGLTGAFYSQSRERLEQARREFHVGNLYLNRKCTGALVDVHPFGGFNMSGTDSKAGGRDYLLLFLQGKSVAERSEGMLRRRMASPRTSG